MLRLVIAIRTGGRSFGNAGEQRFCRAALDRLRKLGDLRGKRVAVIIAHRAPQVKAKAILLRVSDRPRTQALKANKHMLGKGRR